MPDPTTVPPGKRRFYWRPGELAPVPRDTKVKPFKDPFKTKESTRLREYSDDEPRDERGRWSDSGGGGSTAGMTPAQAAGRVVATAGPDSRWSAQNQADVTRAVTDEFARHPELMNGPHPLEGVNYLSSDKPNALSDQTWTNVQYDMREAYPHTVAITLHEPGTTGSCIVLNDSVPFPEWQPGASAQADATAYGALTHELAHAYMGAHTGGDIQSTSDLMETHGIDPITASSMTGSMYAAADPREAFAEMYTTKYVGGGLRQLPPDLQDAYGTNGPANFDLLLQAVDNAQVTEPAPAMPVKAPAGWSASKLLLGPGAAAEVIAAANKNLQAGKWVATLPSLDRFTRQN